ncbi:MAG: hypothetical protein ABIN99_01460, partial [Nitrosospira sp.]
LYPFTLFLSPFRFGKRQLATATGIATERFFRLEFGEIEVYHAFFRKYPLISEAVLKIFYLTAVFSIGLALLSPLHTVAADKAGIPTANAPAGMPDNEGKVLSTLDAPGYTYMELANTEKRFWIAAPTTRVKVGDRVRFEQSLVMKNFNSKTLNRTFDQVIFVNSATIVN